MHPVIIEDKSNKATLQDSIVTLIPSTSTKPNNEFCPPINNSQCETRLTTNQTPQERFPNHIVYLSIDTIRKMLQKFLIEKKMPKIELSKLLGITISDLENILYHEHPTIKLLPKINLPLIKLYCETKWQ